MHCTEAMEAQKGVSQEESVQGFFNRVVGPIVQLREISGNDFLLQLVEM